MFERTGSKYSSLAQSAEHAAVNRSVVGSSPTGGASQTVRIYPDRFFLSTSHAAWFSFSQLLCLRFSTSHVFQRAMKLGFSSAFSTIRVFHRAMKLGFSSDFSTSRVFLRSMRLDFISIDILPPFFSTSRVSWFPFPRYFAAVFQRAMKLGFTSAFSTSHAAWFSFSQLLCLRFSTSHVSNDLCFPTIHVFQQAMFSNEPCSLVSLPLFQRAMFSNEP